MPSDSFLILLVLKIANDTGQSSSRGEEQHEQVEQDDHPAGLEPCLACGIVCAILFLLSLPLVQIFQKMTVYMVTLLRAREYVNLNLKGICVL